mgnify:FL=1
MSAVRGRKEVARKDLKSDASEVLQDKISSLQGELKKDHQLCNELCCCV